MKAISLFGNHASSSRKRAWNSNMSKIYGWHNNNNWATSLMRGEWLQYLAGLVSYSAAVTDIEETRQKTQADSVRFPDMWGLYHDHSTTPDSMSVEAVGRGNLLALTHEGYDGPSALTLKDKAETGGLTSLLLQDPTGQAPAGGRASDHVWVDLAYGAIMNLQAETIPDSWLAGQFRHAANLAFKSASRWKRGDGTYQVTKNFFDPLRRVGYQSASQFGGYNGAGDE